jgi:C-terminal processing protease CtpA/Prc
MSDTDANKPVTADGAAAEAGQIGEGDQVEAGPGTSDTEPPGTIGEGGAATGVAAPMPGSTSTDAAPGDAAGGPTGRRLPSRRATRRVLRSAGRIGLAVLLVAGGVALDRTGALPGSPSSSTTAVQTASAQPSTSSPQFQLIQQAWDLIHAQYVDRAHLDDTALADAGITAITNAIGDTGHTSFETPTDLAAENAALSGHFVGIGIALGSAADGFKIGRVFPDSPAAGAGLGVGDLIVGVDGKDTTGLTLPALVALIAGPEGSPVTLTIRPAVGGPDRPVTMTRAAVTIPVVESAIVPGTRIVDIRLDQFSSGATKALAAAVNKAVAG